MESETPQCTPRIRRNPVLYGNAMGMLGRSVVMTNYIVKMQNVVRLDPQNWTLCFLKSPKAKGSGFDPLKSFGIHSQLK